MSITLAPEADTLIRHTRLRFNELHVTCKYLGCEISMKMDVV